MQSFYIASDSFLHRLNPLSKVLATLPALLFVALTTEPWTPLTFIVLTVALILGLGRIPVGRFLRLAAPLLLLVLGFLLVYPLVVREELVRNSPLLFELGPLRVYQAGVIFGLATALRIYALLMLSLLFTLTTDASDFIRALVQQWRLPYKIGYGALAAFRFVPMLQSELGVIQAAHRVRGIADGKGLRGTWQQMQRYAVPLLATAIRRAERTALAMDGRAFGAFPERTYYRALRFHRRDYFFIGGFWLASALSVLVLWQMGLLGSLVLLQQV
ncbi:MAG: energy-coupling factor transporter transmembrane protein EcfT [Chloroflexaceae bacterium]|jgi:energy-coupling factor transport system permease protein|nr:energy-coupling factor transporter transmembrane protein EcfT [Chloroflexaceae bacterium]